MPPSRLASLAHLESLFGKGILAFLSVPCRRSQQKRHDTWSCFGSAVARATGITRDVSLGSVRCRSGCLSSGPEGLKVAVTMIGPECPSPLMQQTFQWGLHPASPSVGQGGAALAGEGSNQDGESPSLGASGPGRLLLKVSRSVETLVPGILQRGARAERSKSFSVYQAGYKGQRPRLLPLLEA